MIYWSAGTAAIAGVLALLCCRWGGLAGVVGLAGTILAVLLGVAGICISPPGVCPALFLLPTLVLAAAAAFHSRAYIQGHGNPGVYWGFFNLTVATMLALPVITSFVPFLVVWELMGIFSFVLVMFNYKAEELKRVAWIYLLACEAGGLLLMLFYALSLNSEVPQILLILVGMAGFGLKAGFPLLHLWLPEAHPAAPAPVSALMSGAMINLGFYGIITFVLVRAESFAAGAFCGWFLLAVGCIGSLGGIIFAFAQDNLKRLLAYSSIENMGIIAMAMGCAILGVVFDNPVMKIFACIGCALHILNHALLKGTLFLGAGQVYCSTGTLSIDKMGGMMKKTPVTGACFTTASLGISGLPPFNGFVGELMIYLAAFSGICSASPALRGAGILCALVLSLTGACAVVAFSKAVGGTFLGEARQIGECRRESPWMFVPMIVLLFLSVLMVFAAPAVVAALFGENAQAGAAAAILWKAAFFSALFYALTAGILFIRRFLLVRGEENLSGPTWDCGYAKPSARMEYTGSAIVQNLADLFNGFLQIKRKVEPPKGLFPAKASFEWESPDGAERFFWAPLFKFIAGISDRVHKFQSGYLHMYVLIMTVALIAMILWAIFC